MVLESGDPRGVGMSAERLQRVVDMAQGWVAQGISQALLFLVARKGVVVLHEALGCLTPEGDSPPVALDTIYPLISVTMPITATAVMVLVEEGLLGLNRPVQWYIPEFAGGGKDAVMVHHLLTHTSGLRTLEVKNLDVSAFADRKESLEIPPPEKTQHPLLHEFLHLRYDLPLPMQPGVEMNWCTYNYDLLGEIVRRVSGRSLADFSRERIFEPLGMVDTHYIVPESARGRVVRYPADWRYAGLFTDLRLEETPWAGSGAYSTAMDMATFGQMFLNGGTYGGRRILSPASVAEMTRNQIPGISTTYGGKREFFREASWGFGWNIHGNKKDWVGGTLHSPQAFLRSSVDGVLLWADPVYDVVGSFTSVTMEDRDVCHDLFMNAVMAAVVEV